MNVSKLSRSLIVASTLLTTTLPAHANPFEVNSSALFNSTAVTPATAGSIGNVVAPSPQPSPSSSGAVGNAEISGLGDHDSWIDTGVLAEDPRAMCSDVGLGNNESASSGSNSSSSTSISTSSNAETNNDSGGGGFSFLGIGANGSGSAQSSDQNTRSNDDRYSDSSTYAMNSSTVEVGRNCDAFVEAAAARDMNYEDNLTERYGIRVGRRGDQVDNLLAAPR